MGVLYKMYRTTYTIPDNPSMSGPSHYCAQFGIKTLNRAVPSDRFTFHLELFQLALLHFGD